MIKAVIFDYGNVFCRVKDSAVEDDIAQRFGVSRERFLPVARPFFQKAEKGLLGQNKLWDLISHALKKPVPAQKETLFTRKWFEDVIWYEDVFRLLKKLKKLGFKTAVLSNSVSPHTRAIKKLGRFQNFDQIIISHQVHLSKPNPKIYQLTCKRLGVLPKDCLFIDDKQINIIPARKLGMATLLATGPKQVFKEISRRLKI